MRSSSITLTGIHTPLWLRLPFNGTVALGASISWRNNTAHDESQKHAEASDLNALQIVASHYTKSLVSIYGADGTVLYQNSAAQTKSLQRQKRSVSAGAPSEAILTALAAHLGFAAAKQCAASIEVASLGQLLHSAHRLDCANTWYHVEVYVIRNPASGRRAVFVHEHDISSLKEYQHRLKAKTAEATAANKAKSQFLSSMSHEIRTPMNGVCGMAELLSYSDLTPEQRECVSSIQISAAHLLTIINDVLDFSKIEAGKMQIEAVPLDVQAVLNEAVQLAYRPSIHDHLDVVCVVRPGVPRNILGDSTRIRQVLVNLIGNALKFTAEGSVTVVVECVDDHHLPTAGAASGMQSTHADHLVPPNTRKPRLGGLSQAMQRDSSGSSSRRSRSVSCSDADKGMGSGSARLVNGSPALAKQQSGSSDTDVMLRISVTDTGPGISEPKRQMLFEAFTQLDSSTNRTHGGTGLGLAICKQIVPLLGGTITVESKVGAGSTFSFTMRAPRCADPVGSPSTPEPLRSLTPRQASLSSSGGGGVVQYMPKPSLHGLRVGFVCDARYLPFAKLGYGPEQLLPTSSMQQLALWLREWGSEVSAVNEAVIAHLNPQAQQFARFMPAHRTQNQTSGDNSVDNSLCLAPSSHSPSEILADFNLASPTPPAGPATFAPFPYDVLVVNANAQQWEEGSPSPLASFLAGVRHLTPTIVVPVLLLVPSYGLPYDMVPDFMLEGVFEMRKPLRQQKAEEAVFNAAALAQQNKSGLSVTASPRDSPASSAAAVRAVWGGSELPSQLQQTQARRQAQPQLEPRQKPQQQQQRCRHFAALDRSLFPTGRRVFHKESPISSPDTTPRCGMLLTASPGSSPLVAHHLGSGVRKRGRRGISGSPRQRHYSSMSSCTTPTSNKKKIKAEKQERGLVSGKWPLRVAYAEDNVINGKVGRQIMKRLGYDLDVYLNGQLLLDALDAGVEYDMVLMDMQMPVMDGLETTRQIVARYSRASGSVAGVNRAGSRRPVVVGVTANALIEDERACMAVGMDDYVRKPISTNSMSAIVTKWGEKIARLSNSIGGGGVNSGGGNDGESPFFPSALSALTARSRTLNIAPGPVSTAVVTPQSTPMSATNSGAVVSSPTVCGHACKEDICECIAQQMELSSPRPRAHVL